MTIISGSHRLVHRWFVDHPARPGARGAELRASLHRHPYLRDLCTPGGDRAARIARFHERVEEVDGIPLQVLENTARAACHAGGSGGGPAPPRLCFDRQLFKGHLPLGYPHGMEDFLNHQGVLFKQLKPFVLRRAERLRTHSHAMAERAGRPWQYFESPVREDQRAREIASRDGITEGLVCVFATVEPCRSFRLAYGQGRPAIRPAWRKCLFLYFSTAPLAGVLSTYWSCLVPTPSSDRPRSRARRADPGTRRRGRGRRRAVHGGSRRSRRPRRCRLGTVVRRPRFGPPPSGS